MKKSVSGESRSPQEVGGSDVDMVVTDQVECGESCQEMDSHSGREQISPSDQSEFTCTFQEARQQAEDTGGSPTGQSIPPSQLAQWRQSRRQCSPRKYHQGLKQTALLMNSPNSYPILASPSKKRTASSPNKMLSAAGPSPGTSPHEGSFNKALWRDIPGTYLENLRIVLETVLSEPQDVALLGEWDIEVIERFKTVSLAAQKLYVRLLQRKLDLKRLSKIVYEDVCDRKDMGKVVQEMVEAGFFLREEDLGGLPEFLEVLTVAEVQHLCKEMKVSAKGKKEDRMKALIKFSQQQPSIKVALFSLSKTVSKPSASPLLKKVKEVAGPCLKLDVAVHRVFLRVLMLYGLPCYDDMEEGGPQATLTALLLINLGKMKFPTYATNRTRAIFRAREDVLRFESCCQMNNELQKCIEAKKWEAALEHCHAAKDIYQQLSKDDKLLQHDRSLPRFLRRFTTLSLLVYMLNVLVELLQKVRQYETAVNQLEELLGQDTYLQDHRGLWYTRLALNLHSHLRKPAKALEVIEQGLSDTELQHTHRLTLSMRARRLARTEALAKRVANLPLVEPVVVPRVVIQGRSLHGDTPGYKRAFIRQDSDRHAGEGAVTLCSVEELVIEHYQHMGYPEGLHMEGTTVRSLFGLLFWEVLYAPVPDAFRSPHQASPLDLLDQHFYTARKELIDKRLGEMCTWSEEDIDAETEQVWCEHKDEQCLVAWNIFSSLSYVQGLIKSLGTEVLAAVCERLTKNYRHTRSGFPDLIVWNPSSKKARIVEVKGPNDTLSVKQEVWLDFLVSCGAVAEVCHVEAVGAKKMIRTTTCKASSKKVSPKKSSIKVGNSDDDGSDVEYMPTEARATTKRVKGSDCEDLIEEYSESHPKRSTRRAVSYCEDDSEDDFVCPEPKKSKYDDCDGHTSKERSVGRKERK